MINRHRHFRVLVSAFIAATAYAAEPAPAPAGGADADALAKKLQNPVAALISVPLQDNLDFGMGANNDGWRNTLNVQPVLPFELSAEWNLISRTIVPLIYQDNVAPGDPTFGSGDISQSLFFSPRAPGPGGLIWAIGPVFLLPTASDAVLGSKKWGIGPTGLALVQSGPWTYGLLANHIWSVAGDSQRQDISATFLQPFAGYAFGKGLTGNVNIEATYDWTNKQWTAPLYIGASQILKLGSQLLSLSAGPRFYLDSPTGGPEWGLRVAVTLLFPK